MLPKATQGNPWLLKVTHGPSRILRVPKVTQCHQTLSNVTKGNLCPCVNQGYSRILKVPQGSVKLPKVTQGYQWLSKVTQGSNSSHKVAYSFMSLHAVT